MQKKNHFGKVLAFVTALLAFTACSYEPAKTAKPVTDDSTTYIKLKYVRPSDALQENARAVDVATLDFVRFELVGVPSTNTLNAQIVNWFTSEDIETAEAAEEELEAAKVAVLPDVTYTFTLKAITAEGVVYQDTCDPTLIEVGENELSFTLKPYSLGSKDKTGTAEIAVNLPEGVSRLTVSVYKVNTANGIVAEDPENGFDEKEIEIGEDDRKALFQTGDLSVGSYCAVFNLWGGVNGDVIVATWREFFGIAGGLNNKIELNTDEDEIPILEKVFSITFHTDGGTEPALKSFSAKSVLTTSVLISEKEGYSIEGWYFDESFNKRFTSTEGICTNIDLYAKWSQTWGQVVEIKKIELSLSYEQPNAQDPNLYKFTATADYQDGDIFTWIVDNEVIKTGSSNEMELNLNSDSYEVGVHTVVVIYQRNGVPYSEMTNVSKIKHMIESV